MNTRIKELAKEHLLHGKYNGDGDLIEGEYYEFDPDELEKFVELIVRECAARATGSQNTCEEDIGGEVLKYFGLGVEE
jgi:hypothetical protein